MKIPARLAVALLGAFGLAAPAVSQQLTNAQREAAVEFTLNNTWHVMLHEIGHLFVDQFQLPVLGKEEDAVDALATLIILEEDGLNAQTILADTIDGWLYAERERPTRGYTNSDFYGEHSLDIQRSFSLACLMVGSDFDAYTRHATRVGLPIDRQISCADDFELASRSWKQVLAPHKRVDAYGAKVEVEYLHHDREYEDIAHILKQSRILERAADWVTKTHVIVEPVLITAEHCGEVNAFFIPSDQHIMLCYEWAGHFYDMFVETIMPEREHFANMARLKREKMAR